MNKTMQEELIGEIEGLRAVLQATLGTLALYAGPGSNVLEGVHALAHESIRTSNLTVHGCDTTVIKLRAETVVDRMVSTIKVTHHD